MKATQSDNFYSILGVSENAPLADIKVAFIKIIKEVHPDKSLKGTNQSPEYVIRIIEAWTVLKDEDLRKKYDESLKTEKQVKGYSSYKYTFKIDIQDAEVEDDMLKFSCEQCGDRTSIRLTDLSVAFS